MLDYGCWLPGFPSHHRLFPPGVFDVIFFSFVSYFFFVFCFFFVLVIVFFPLYSPRTLGPVRHRGLLKLLLTLLVLSLPVVS